MLVKRQGYLIIISEIIKKPWNVAAPRFFGETNIGEAMPDSENNIPHQDENDNYVDDGNWVKEHRRIMEHKIWKNPRIYQMWRFLIMEAKWKDDVYSDGTIKIELKRGQLVGSLSYLSKMLNITRNVANRETQTLQKWNCIETEVKQGLRIITILNYERYQCARNSRETEEKQKRNRRETEEKLSKELKTKEFKKGRIQKEEESNSIVNPQLSVSGSRKPKKVLPISGGDKILAEKWLAFAKEKLPFLKQTQESFAQEIYKARNAVGLDDRQMEGLFNFVIEDDFWKTNCYSPAGLLRKSKNGLRKIDNILAKVRKDKYSHADVLEWARKADEAEARGEKMGGNFFEQS